MNEISESMQAIIASSKQINNDSKATDGYIKEISQIVEDSQRIAKENEVAFEKIESTSNSLKQSVI